MKNDARGVGMNAVEFVRKFGWEEAKKASVSIFNGDVTYKREEINIDDLKRLVDSWEFVQSYSGLAMAKRQYSCFANACESVGANKSPRVLALGKAIADVESVGGGV